ncbi:hypothetical protein [Hymenobacter yonginensis]|uniref:Uncharacterized protein n=1 Tax=Hymenobacter yonginensis TaxID=748197 RepID=A0ABY7PTG4_9BACT|nr:hypothetical protein [Hymenobacter yonginensis]WBO86118.1 hypothetical protein O9Z63_07640 [Hymenobacter yonginensis]
MRVVLTALLWLLLALAYAQTPEASTTLLTNQTGFTGPDAMELNSMLGVEKQHFELSDPRLAGRVLHLTYQEFRDGVAQPEQDLLGKDRSRFQLDSAGRLAFNVYARAATDARLEVRFFFPTIGKRQQFQPLPGALASDYSLRADIQAYKKQKASVPVGRKFPLLVYTLPYVKDGFLYYCDLAQSKVPPAEWFKKFGIRHFVVYQLTIE